MQAREGGPLRSWSRERTRAGRNGTYESPVQSAYGVVVLADERVGAQQDAARGDGQTSCETHPVSSRLEVSIGVVWTHAGEISCRTDAMLDCGRVTNGNGGSLREVLLGALQALFALLLEDVGQLTSFVRTSSTQPVCGLRLGVDGTCRAQRVLVYALIALRSELRPEEGTFAGAGTATKEDQLLGIGLGPY